MSCVNEPLEPIGFSRGLLTSIGYFNSQIEELTKDNKTIIVRIAQLEKERDEEK